MLSRGRGDVKERAYRPIDFCNLIVLMPDIAREYLNQLECNLFTGVAPFVTEVVVAGNGSVKILRILPRA
jgi:hypothetical protein